MKEHPLDRIARFFFVITGMVVLMTAYLFGQNEPAIRWNWQSGRILERYDGGAGKKLEFGLREDGVVVWRETTFATNSPAEMHWRRGRMEQNPVNPAPVPAPVPLTNRAELATPPLPQ